MRLLLLDNSMFDDGSLDCKTMGLNHNEGTDLYSGFNYLKEITEPEIFNELINLVQRREEKEMRWLDVRHYNIYYGGVQLLEIVWD